MSDIAEQVVIRAHRSRRSLARRTALWLQQTRDATRAYRDFLVREVDAWRSLVADVGTGLTRKVAPRSLERSLLTRVDTLLARAHTSVGEQLARLDGVIVTQPPFAGYEEMTARAIVAELGSLDEASCRAVLAFEASHKGRATVLRAAEMRLAA